MKKFRAYGLINGGVLASAFFFAAFEAKAWVNLRQVQVSNGTQVDLLFDKRITKNQIKTEYFNDIIQISLSEVSVYPAKISSVTGNSLLKVFAYQYGPKLVRCRLTVKGKAEDYKNRFQIKNNGKVLTLQLEEDTSKSDNLVLQAAHANRVTVPPAKNDSDRPPSTPQVLDPEERALLDRVLGGRAQPSENSKAKEPEKESAKPQIAPPPSTQSVLVGPKENPAISGAKPFPSPLRALAKLLGVIALFLVLAFVAKKIFVRRSVKKRDLFGAITRFARMKLGQKEKIIEVVSNHYLGPKKSICVVKVAGRYLVLGISNESIQLITQLPGDAFNSVSEESPESPVQFEELAYSEEELRNRKARLASAAAGAEAAGPVMFAEMFRSERIKPIEADAAPSGGIRAQIRSKLDGLKPL